MKEQLERECAVFFGKETDIRKRLSILQGAYWQTLNAGYCDAMAWKLASNGYDAQTEYWELACKHSTAIRMLCEIYEKELEAKKD